MYVWGPTECKQSINIFLNNLICSDAVSLWYTGDSKQNKKKEKEEVDEVMTQESNCHVMCITCQANA